MPPSPKSSSQATYGVRRLQPRQAPDRAARLHAAMACDTAFRVVARRYLRELAACHELTCDGDPDGLHQMRIALTRLRTAILFFSPMVADSRQTRIRAELKWLNTQLGIVRDLDVAIERLNATNKDAPHTEPHYRSWSERRVDGHRTLARALRSPRYRRVMSNATRWIESGPWSTSRAKRAVKERASPIAEYSADKLARWQQKLLKKSRNLLKMDAEERHRLRLLNKKLSYSLETFDDLASDKRFSGQQVRLKHLRKAQRSLGQLNDDANSHALATELERDGAHPALQFLSPKREKRLLKAAVAAYRKLAAMKP
jgi:CHAD domain-containing protein